MGSGAGAGPSGHWLPASLSPGSAWGSGLFTSVSSSRSTLSSWLFRKLQQRRWSCGETRGLPPPGPCRRACGVRAGPQGLQGPKRGVVTGSNKGGRKGWGGESVVLGTPGLSPGLAKGELSVLGWTLGVRGTPQYQKATEVQEAVPSRLGEAAPHPWSAAPGSPTGRTQGLISCRKNPAQGRLGPPHLGAQWPGPGRAQPLTLSRRLQVQRAGPALVQTQGQGPPPVSHPGHPGPCLLAPSSAKPWGALLGPLARPTRGTHRRLLRPSRAAGWSWSQGQVTTLL